MSQVKAEVVGRAQEVLMRALPLLLLVFTPWINGAVASSLDVD